MIPLATVKKPKKAPRVPAPHVPMNEIEPILARADWWIINTSAGKDSQTAMRRAVQTADRLGVSRSKLVAIHADLGRVEWIGTKELAKEQADHYGLDFVTVRRTGARDNGADLLEYVRRRRKWPDSARRFCTSDFKRGPIRCHYTVLANRTRESGITHRPALIVNIMGMRGQESPNRRVMPNWKLNDAVNERGERIGASNGRRTVYDWLPIHTMTADEVWADIRASGVRHHWAYDAGMPRLSCCFCIFSPRAGLRIAGRHNLELLREYVAVEREIGHKFRRDFSLADVLRDVESDLAAGGNAPKLVVNDWEM